jgi:hypothetical protein
MDRDNFTLFYTKPLFLQQINKYDVNRTVAPTYVVCICVAAVNFDAFVTVWIVYDKSCVTSVNVLFSNCNLTYVLSSTGGFQAVAHYQDSRLWNNLDSCLAWC